MAAPTSTSSPTFVAAGGPSLTVSVPPSGTIQVTASVEGRDDDGAVSLYQDGNPMPGLPGAVSPCLGPESTFFDVPSTSVGGQFLPDVYTGPYGTPGGFDVYGCMTTGVPGPVTFQTTPGVHTYELRYAFCGCTGTEATFFNRKLWVTPMP